MKNDVNTSQHRTISKKYSTKPPMSKTLVNRTNKEFDKCAELLRNILSVQESRRETKPSTVRETKHRKQQPVTRPKTLNDNVSIPKSSYKKSKTNLLSEKAEHRSSHSPCKPIVEETLSRKKTRQQHTRPSPSSTKPKKFSSRRRQFENDEEELVRSSSCGDLPSSKSKLMSKARTNLIFNQLTTHLTRIRTISKQIRTQNFETMSDHVCDHLWTDLEQSLSAALSFVNNDMKLRSSLLSLRSDIDQLRKQLQVNNRVHSSHKFETNQCDQLLLQNERLRSKCSVLQDKLDRLERNNIRLLHRLTEQDIHSISQRTEWVTTENRFLLREEIKFLKGKLYHVYDDLATLFNRNYTLQTSVVEQNRHVVLYQEQLDNIKRSAEHLLRELDHQSQEEKVKRFLNNILLDQHSQGKSRSPSKPAQSVNTPSLPLRTSYKSTAVPAPSSVLHTTNKIRPQSLSLTPVAFNDPVGDLTHSSFITMNDVDSNLTSSSPSVSSYYQQRRRTNLYNSLPTLNEPSRPSHLLKPRINIQHVYSNESSPELDQISDLTSKMFSSEDDEDVSIRTATSSSLSSSGPFGTEEFIQI